jgi:HNH endonuclease
MAPAGQRCPEHRHGWGKGNPRTNTRAHRNRRERILQRDHHQCQIRYEGICIGHATIADHVLALALGGQDTDDAMQAACAPCHNRKSSIEGHKAQGHRTWGVAGPPAAGPKQPRKVLQSSLLTVSRTFKVNADDPLAEGNSAATDHHLEENPSTNTVRVGAKQVRDSVSGSRRRWCSDACRMKSYRAHKRLERSIRTTRRRNNDGA